MNTAREAEGAEITAEQKLERSKGLVFEDGLPGMQAGKRAGMCGEYCASQKLLKMQSKRSSVVWVPDANLLDVGYTEAERADQTLKSIEDFVPEEWGLPPYDA